MVRIRYENFLKTSGASSYDNDFADMNQTPASICDPAGLPEPEPKRCRQ